MSQSKAQLLDPQGDLTLPGLLIGVGATFSGNVSIGGTLTKQDVTNVDSVGLITARSGIEVTGGDITIPDKIVHLGDTDTCIRFPGTDIITMERSGSEVFRLDSSGLKIPDKLIHQGDIDTFLEFGTDTINFDTGGTERLRITSAGLIGIGTDNPSAYLDIESNASSGNVAEFRSVHASNSARILIDSPADNNIRPSAIVLANAGTDKWGIGQVYGSSSSGAFHICAGSASEVNSKLTLTTSGSVGIGTVTPDYSMEIVGANPVLTIRDTETSQNSANARLRLAETGSADSLDNYWDVAIDGQELKIIEGNLTTSTADTRLTIATDGDATFAGNVSDSKGDIRSIPKLIKSSNHTLVASDAGCAVFVNAAANVTVNDGVLTLGDAVTIVNHHTADITIIQDSGMTMYNSNNASTGNRTLASRGIATIWFAANDTAYISGSGLS